MNENKNALSVNLRSLLYIQMATVVITLINTVSNLDSITQWVTKVLNLVTIMTLFQLKNLHPRYKTAAIATLIGLICGVLTTPVNSSAVGFSSILLLVGSTCFWVASYQEYHGHGELIGEADEKLAKKWNGLFTWEVVIGLAISAVSVFGTTVMVIAGMSADTTTTVIIALSTLSGLAFKALYILYMKKTLTLIETET